MISILSNQNIKINKNIILFFSALFIFLFAANAKAEGASFYFSPASGSYPIGKEFVVNLKTDTGGQPINAAEGGLVFDKDKLEITGIMTDESIFNFWVPKKPVFSNSNGTITFGGGLPRPGYTGTAGSIISIKFKAKSIGDAQTIFSSGAILANDSKSTNILTAMGSASYKIIPESLAPKEEVTEKNQEVKEEEKKAIEKKQENLEIIPGSFITSPTHPDQSLWYSTGTAVINWSLPDGADGVSVAISNSINAEPDNISQGIIASKQFDNLKDGVWYFRLKIKTKKEWSKTFGYRLQIDTTPPEMIQAFIDQVDPENWPTIFFKSKDSGSGILKYEINIGSLEERGLTIPPDQPSVLASGLSAGEHTAIIKAVDKAGNQSLTELKFTILPIKMPEISYLPVELKPSEKPFFSGKALKNVKINLYIENESSKTIVKSTSADESGNWFILGDSGMENGRYMAWAEAVNINGLKSHPTPKASFVVSPPIFVRVGGYIINYFTVIASLLLFLILIIASIIFLAAFIRKRRTLLKKETYEIEKVLGEKLDELRREVDEEFKKISSAASMKTYANERKKARSVLNNKIDSAGKRILKEVKDVEDILK